MTKSKKSDESKAGSKDLSIKDQQHLISEEVQRFIALSKQKGELTIEEINEQLPAEIIAPEVLDSFMQALDVGGVKISDLSGNKEAEGEETSEFLADPNREEEEEEVSAE